MSAQPIQIVRTLKKGELTPTYSTAELLSGVRHFVVIPEAHANKETRRIAQEKMLGAARGVETQKKRAGERFRSRLPVIKEMLAQGSTNMDIWRGCR